MDFPKAFLFDLDGVLIDTEPLHGKAWARAANKYGAQLTISQLEDLKGKRRVECAKQIIKWINIPIELTDFLSIHQPISYELLKRTKAMPYAEELVKWCEEIQLPMCLVTSSNKNSVEFKTSNLSWFNLIKYRVQGDDSQLKQGKPKPDPYLLAAKKVGFQPNECWAIEDSNAGMESALKAGCKVWLLNNSSNHLEKKMIKGEISKKKLKVIKSLKVILSELKSLYK